MKLSELTPCACCGQPVMAVFYRITIEQMVVDARTVEQILGLNQCFGGNALPLAENFAPGADVAVKKTLQKRAIVCHNCVFESHTVSHVFSSKEDKPDED